MRAVLKRLLGLVIVITMLSAPFALVSSAAEQQSEYWNIMLVIDGSASLWSGIRSDPEGLRYEAIKSFLYTLESRGNMVGAIVFNANQTTDSSDQAMATGILVNTGLYSLETGTAGPRDGIADSIEGAKKINTNTEQTDIGTALLVAERELQKYKNNGNRSAVFLFSDGDLQVNGSIKDKALENLRTAEQEMRDNGITFCGVLLNVNGSETDEIRDIAYAANGITPGMALENHYIEITDSASCAESTDRFLELLGYTVEKDPDAIYESFTKEFRVPGIGVEEATIRLRTDKGNPLPENMEVTIIRPDGTAAPASEMASIYSIGRTYHAYKLEKPQSGKWTVRVTVPEGNSIAIFYSPVVSFSIDCGLKTDVQPADMFAGQTINVECFLMRNNTPITDPDCYREYGCRLVLEDVSTGVPNEIEITPVNGVFTVPITLPYGVYQAHTEFYCDELKASSVHVGDPWDLRNHPPTAKDTVINITCSILDSGEETLDLKPYIDDLEDGKNLSVAIVGGSCDMDGADVSGQELALKGKKCGSGTVKLSVTDSQGASASMTVSVKVENKNTVYIIAAAAALAVIAAAVVLLLILRNKLKLTGSLTVDMTVFDEDGNDVTVSSVSLKKPGNGGPRKCTLDWLLQDELRQDFSSIRDQLQEDKLESLQEFLASGAGKAFTQSIRFSPAAMKKDGRRVAALQVSAGKKIATLYNDSTEQFSRTETRINIRYDDLNDIDEEDPDEPLEDTGLEKDPYDPEYAPLDDDEWSQP